VKAEEGIFRSEGCCDPGGGVAVSPNALPRLTGCGGEIGWGGGGNAPCAISVAATAVSADATDWLLLLLLLLLGVAKNTKFFWVLRWWPNSDSRRRQSRTRSASEPYESFRPSSKVIVQPPLPLLLLPPWSLPSLSVGGGDVDSLVAAATSTRQWLVVM